MAFVALTVISGIIKYKSAKKYIAVILGSIGLLLFFLIALKPASSSGRFLILKIAMLNWKKFIFPGTGYGNFANIFPHWQIDYFDKLDIKNINQYLNADEVYIAFNEPLQLLIEKGIVGLLIFLVFVYFLVLRRYNQSNSLISCAEGMIVIILITSVFYYSFHVNAIFFILIVCVAF